MGINVDNIDDGPRDSFYSGIPVPRDVKVRDFLQEKLDGCTKCTLSSSRTNIVYYRGNPKGKIMVVGEAPGFNEDTQSTPMVGKSGALLVSLMEKYGLTLYDYCIINVVQCRPPDNADPTSEQMDQCLEHFWLYLDIVKPQYMITVGRISTQRVIYGTVNSKIPISSMEGKVFDTPNYPGIQIYPITHPAAILRNPHKMDDYERRIEIMCNLIREDHIKKSLPLRVKEVIKIEEKVFGE